MRWSDFFKVLGFPMSWAFLLVLHISFFSTDPSPHFFLQLFDKIMILSCFLLYPVQALQLEGWADSYLPFVVQFLFWWFFSYFMLIAYRKLKRAE